MYIFPRPCPWDFFRQLARRDVLFLALFTRLACRAISGMGYFGRGLFRGYQGKSVFRAWVVLNWTEEKGTEVIAHMIAAAKLIAYFMFSARDILDALHPGCARQALVAVILGYIQDFSAVVGYELLQAAGVVRDVQVGFVVEFDCVFHGAYCFVCD